MKGLVYKFCVACVEGGGIVCGVEYGLFHDSIRKVLQMQVVQWVIWLSGGESAVVRCMKLCVVLGVAFLFLNVLCFGLCLVCV